VHFLLLKIFLAHFELKSFFFRRKPRFLVLKKNLSYESYFLIFIFSSFLFRLDNYIIFQGTKMAEYNAEILRILNNNYQPSIRWSNRCPTSSYQKNLKEKIKRFLLALSGNDLISMLNDVLVNEEVAMLKYAQMHMESLRNISQAVNSTKIVKPKSKHYFIRPLRHSGFSLSQVRKLGFICSYNLWTSCLNENDRHLGGGGPKYRISWSKKYVLTWIIFRTLAQIDLLLLGVICQEILMYHTKRHEILQSQGNLLTSDIEQPL
jgi:hypothetical protein